MHFVFDIDGTLCFDGKTIDTSIVTALYTLVHDGHDITFASARPIRDLVPVLPESFRNGRLVGGNGCFTQQDGIITANIFTPALLTELQNIIRKHNLTYLADGEWDYAYTGNIEHPIYKNIDQTSAKNVPLSSLQKVCKLVLFSPNEDVLATLNTLPVNITTYKTENAIDISPLGINKVHGLHQLGIYDFIAFGNDSNDQCLFEHALFSVCVGEHDVKQYASKVITRDNVGEVICEVSTRFKESMLVR